jgi:hypothetical protein
MKVWSFSKKEFVEKLTNHPYRNSSKAEVVKKVYKRTPEEVIQSFRRKIPGPLRRLLAVVGIVPTYVLSALLAVFVVAPTLYILTGKWKCWFDFYGDRDSDHSDPPRITLRGTHSLFFDLDKWQIKYLRRKHGYLPLGKEEDEDSEHQYE